MWRGSGATLWRAVYAYSGGRCDVADDSVAEAFARVMARGSEVSDPLAYLYRVAFRGRERRARTEREGGGRGAGDGDRGPDPERPARPSPRAEGPDAGAARRGLSPLPSRHARASGGAADGHVERGSEGAPDARPPPAGVAPR